MNILRLSILLSSILFLTACPKQKDFPRPTGTMAATIDGTNWSANYFNAYDTVTTYGREFLVGGYNTGQDQIDINFYHLTNPGIYPIVPFNTGTDTTGFAIAKYYTGNQPHVADTGTIVVTRVSAKNVTGTFHFVTDDGKNITNGSFNVTRL